MPGERKEGRKEERKEGRQEGRRKKGSKKGSKEDKKERMENPGRKEGMPRNKGIREGRKEGETQEARKEGRKIRRKERRTPTPSTLIQVVRIILLLIIIIIVRPQYSNYIKRRQMPKALRRVASSIFAPAKTEPIMDPLRTRDKGVCKWGWAAPPPLTQPLSFIMPCRLVFKNPGPVIKMFANGFAPCRLSFKKIAPSTRIASNTWRFLSHRLSVCK